MGEAEETYREFQDAGIDSILVRGDVTDEASFVTGQTLCVNGGMAPW